MVVEEVEENTSITGSENLSVLLLGSESLYRQWKLVQAVDGGDG
jgi:hypothetical protein